MDILRENSPGPDMPEIPPVHRPTEQEKQAVIDEFATQMRQIKEHKEAAKVGLDEALSIITKAIRHHWGTGGGRRLRQIVWSLWNGHTLVALWDVLGGLDHELGRAVVKLIEAKLMGALDRDEILRRVLTESGEFARYDDAARDTPEGEEVIYPPLQISAESLRNLADAAESKERRIEAERREENARSARLEEAHT